MKKTWNYQPVLNVLMTACIVLLAFPVLTQGRRVPMAITFPNNAFVNFGNITPANISVRTYIMRVQFPVDSSEHFIMVGEKSDMSIVWYVNYDASAKKIYFLAYRSTSPGLWSTPADFSDSLPHFIGISYDDSSTLNDPVIYVDSAAGAITEDITPSGTKTDAYNLIVGGGNTGITLGTVTIYDSRIYNYIATAADIANIYNSRSFNVHPAQGLPVFQPVLYGSAGLQNFAVALAAGNTIVDPYSGARGVPAGSPVGVAETYLTVNP